MIQFIRIIISCQLTITDLIAIAHTLYPCIYVKCHEIYLLIDLHDSLKWLISINQISTKKSWRRRKKKISHITRITENTDGRRHRQQQEMV